MKRESHSEASMNLGLVGDCPAQESSCAEVDDSTSCKRLKITQVNGYIVYTRTKKFRSNDKVKIVDDEVYNSNEEPRLEGSRTRIRECIVQESARVDTLNENKAALALVDRSSLVRNVIEDGTLVDVVIDESQEGSGIFEIAVCPMLSLDDRLEFKAEEELLKDIRRNHTRRRHFRRSLPELVAVKKRESLEFDVQVTDNKPYPDLDVTFKSEACVNGVEMLEEVVLTKRPTTVKELFDTGLLDGVSVVYMGSVKSQAFGLRGIIKDGGILCSCCLCKGSRVIPPSKFEIHACKQYRRALQYICFLNGKSLLEVLMTCRSCPLHALGATIRSLVTALPFGKSFTCKRCKGLFPISGLSKTGPECSACSESVKSQNSPIHATSITARSSEPILSTTASSGISVCFSSSKKNQMKIIRKLSEQNSFTKSTEDASICRSPQKKVSFKIMKKSRKQHNPAISSQEWDSKITKKDQGMHKMIFEEGGLPDGTELTYVNQGQILLKGYIEGSSIFCQCCKEKVSPSQFEAHAGWASRRKPYAYIYTADGKSLHEWMTAFSKGQAYSAEGEKLLEHDTDASFGGCIKCGDTDFATTFGPRTMILCDQCDKEHHIGCLNRDSDREIRNMEELPKGKWFCCSECENIHLTLQNLQVKGAKKLSESLLRVVRKNYEKKSLGDVLNSDVRWRLLSTKIIANDTKELLFQALAIFLESFDPIIDQETQRNLIPLMVFGNQDFGGLCCAVLTVNSYVVSCAILRVFGQEVAELPLVATRTGYRGKGYFHLLFSCLEKLFSFMGVRKLVLPSAKQTEAMWMRKFGFRKIEAKQLRDLTKIFFHIISFEGSMMLQKPIPSYQLL